MGTRILLRACRGGGPTKQRLIKRWVSFASQILLGEKTLLEIERNWLSLWKWDGAAEVTCHSFPALADLSPLCQPSVTSPRFSWEPPPGAGNFLSLKKSTAQLLQIP